MTVAPTAHASGRRGAGAGKRVLRQARRGSVGRRRRSAPDHHCAIGRASAQFLAHRVMALDTLRRAPFRLDIPRQSLSGHCPAERSDISRSAGPGFPPDAFGDRHRAASRMRRCPAAAPAQPVGCWGGWTPSLMATATTSDLASGLLRHSASPEGVASSKSDTSRWLPIRRRRRPPSPLADVPTAPPGPRLAHTGSSVDCDNSAARGESGTSLRYSTELAARDVWLNSRPTPNGSVSNLRLVPCRRSCQESSRCRPGVVSVFARAFGERPCMGDVLGKSGGRPHSRRFPRSPFRLRSRHEPLAQPRSTRSATIAELAPPVPNSDPTGSRPPRRRFRGRRRYREPVTRVTQSSRRLRSEPARTRALT